VITYELTRREIETETILYKYFIDKYAWVFFGWKVLYVKLNNLGSHDQISC
jgi:hypothetical protein